MKLCFTVIILCLSLSVKAQNRRQLDSIKLVLEQTYDHDQQPRFFLDTLQRRYGSNSPEVNKYWQYINAQDSTNRKVVASIIDTYGWLSPDETSPKANAAIILVIQHADIETQIKYLPALKNAISEGKVKPDKYAYLSDRIKMNTGYYQTYGTQIGSDYKGNLCFWPIEDEPDVNKRRVSMGLDSIQYYAKNFNIVYKAPKADSLKGNVIITCFTNDQNQHALRFVNIYASGNKLIGQTNADGVLRVIIPRGMLNAPFVFQKQGFKTSTFIEKGNGDVFYVHVLLSKLQ